MISRLVLSVTRGPLSPCQCCNHRTWDAWDEDLLLDWWLLGNFGVGSSGGGESEDLARLVV